MNSYFKLLSRMLPVAGFSILSGLSGIGITWIVVGLIAENQSRDAADKMVAGCMPILIAGGAAGFVIGALASVKILKMKPEKQGEVIKQYVRPQDRFRIYMGVPVFIIVLLMPLFRQMDRIVGQNADVYVDLGIGLAILALSLVLYDHIPPKFIIPLSIVCWILTLFFLLWYGLFGPGAFGHATLP